ncbi:NAD(P)-binding protein [Viridothelium virens]|uniref:NAD(P)-binding protein n=1 Tax=Viridothelium virens TaxID=1048519 RepID=A0A6A6HCK6_VIRVR|nr:NAD(P)-binding protein [Viridothelium virens]
MSKTFLITGATGKQGGGTVDALLASPEASDSTILAVTRNPHSPGAQKLASKAKNIKIVKGDFNNVPAMFDAAREANGGKAEYDGLFLVQVPKDFKGQTPEKEEQQGKAMVDEAIKRRVRHFVYSSVDRHGERSLQNPTPVPHFISKHNIETHLLEKAKDSNMTYTIIRPVAFLENLTPDFMGKMFATTWREALGEVPLQLVSTTDIGIIASKALLRPEEFRNRQMGLAGDDLNFNEANKIYKEKFGTELPTSYGFLANGFLWMVGEMNAMFKWFRDERYAANIEECKKINPDMMSFGDYLVKKFKT